MKPNMIQFIVKKKYVIYKYIFILEMSSIILMPTEKCVKINIKFKKIKKNDRFLKRIPKK